MKKAASGYISGFWGISDSLILRGLDLSGLSPLFWIFQNRIKSEWGSTNIDNKRVIMVRLRHRYIVAEVLIDGDWKSTKLTRANSLIEGINSSIRTLHGVQGVALSKAGLLAKYVNNSTKICFIRMRRSAFEIVRSSLPFVKNLDGQPMRFKTIYTGATIRHCNIFLEKYHRRELELKYGSLKSDLQRQIFEKELPSIPQLFLKIG